MKNFKLRWINLASVNFQGSIVRRFKEVDFGVIKEERCNIQTPNDISTIYYINGDRETYLDEDGLIARMDSILKQNKIIRINTIKPPCLIGIPKFTENALPIFYPLVKILDRNGLLYTDSNQTYYHTLQELLENNTLFKELFENGKTCILRSSSNI